MSTPIYRSADGHDDIPETKVKPTTEEDEQEGSTAEGAMKALDMFLEADSKFGGSTYSGLVLGGERVSS